MDGCGAGCSPGQEVEVKEVRLDGKIIVCRDYAFILNTMFESFAILVISYRQTNHLTKHELMQSTDVRVSRFY
jgi:hypothetical protein